MIKFILARVGGGKTTCMMQQIRDFSANPDIKMTLIVPEQNTFTCEKDVLEQIGPAGNANIDVVSFTELAEKLTEGSFSRDRYRLSESSAAVLMSFALENTAGNLKLYKKHAGRKSTVRDFLSLSDEFKHSCISVDDILDAASKMDEGLLKAKLTDIGVVLREYEQLVGEKYFNPDDLLTELASSAELDSYFSGRIVFIDSFRGFSAQEYGIIEHIVVSAKAVFVTLCTEDLENSGDITDLFAESKDTASRIINIARRNGIEVAVPLYLSKKGKYCNFPPDFVRYTSPELAFLESQLYSDTPNIYGGKCENVVLYKAENIYSECDFVAATIKRLIRRNGYRYRDIAVIARNMDTYELTMRSALKKYDIYAFEDRREPVSSSPVINAVMAAVATADKGFDTETILGFLKTGLTDLSTDDISLLEEYCYVWNINGRKWLEKWTLNPDGFGDESADAKEKLETINLLREKVVRPVEKFRTALKGGVDGKTAAQALWDFLTDIRINPNLRKLAGEFRRDGREGAVAELDRMWTVLTETIDEFNTLTQGRKITASSLYGILDTMFSAKTVGVLPEGLDEIVLGSADRMRISAPKVTFVIGANSGVFPSDSLGSSSLTPRDRTVMEETYGLALSGGGDMKLADEKLIAYCSVCSPKEKLFVSCCSGSEMFPSEFYERIKSLFPDIKELSSRTLDGLYFSEAKQSAFEQYAASPPGRFRSAAEKYFESDSEYSGKLEALRREADEKSFRISDSGIAGELFGKNMLVSPSKVEQYYRCPFSYFCRYGIKAMPRKRAELGGDIRGNVIHFVFEQLLKQYSVDQLSSASGEELFEIISKLMNDYLFASLSGAEQNERFLFLYNRLKYTVFEIAKRMIEEFSVTEFVPVDFELSIGRDDEIGAYVLENENGSVSIEGKIDRVDVAEYDGKNFFRIIDYKSGNRHFRPSDISQGLNMQMFLYLLAMWKNGEKRYGGDLAPAGLLYCKAASPFVAVSRNDGDEEIKQKMLKDSKMDGMVLEDSRIIELMEQGAGGMYIPASITSKGEFKGNCIPFDALLKLKDKADKLVLQMSDLLKNGEIAAIPAHSGSTEYATDYSDVCKYCDYKPVCGHTEEMPVRELVDLDIKQVIENLEEEDEDNGQA